jgi:hypothetical protein
MISKKQHEKKMVQVTDQEVTIWKLFNYTKNKQPLRNKNKSISGV